MLDFATTQKAADVDADLNFVLSDETVDRVGDVIDSKSWKLANFRKNPIALFNHSHSMIIGKWSNVRVDGKKLIGKLNLAEPGTSRMVDEVRALIEQGLLKATSVGFRPGDVERKGDGFLLRDCELLEVSLVSVPANPNAVALAKSLDISAATRAVVFADTGAKAIPPATPGDPAVPMPRAQAARAFLKSSEGIGK